ncbi:hypothetical protein BOTBODRAFT_177947 [Botryobasidium botryosum FD-172 SS1]|uniref:F-box domain-containing protein n=1 Tax=Botryobasidium botryosum (strain FD-172 SS1) TaxID=930990 RepID=A0A067MGF2_BOTB1|nr:hypothetical protein BOTBODRAFT_177947 [Botryobasidium botryosum FD-172 SS1]
MSTTYAADAEEREVDAFEPAVECPTWTPNLNRAFIHALPYDVLVAIFNFVVDAYRNFSRRLDTVHTRAPLNIARVCKSWRKIALETPSLWTQIGPPSAPFIRTFLARSEPELLDIFWDPMELPESVEAAADRITSFFQPFQSHADRVKSLDIWCTPLSAYQRYLDFPAPRPEKIYASGPGDIAYEPLDIPVFFFCGHTPQLRELYLAHMCISLDSPVFSNLVYLHMEHIVYTRSRPTQLIQVLSACSALERFQLTNVHFLFASGNPTAQINLPLLEDFFLYALPLKTIQYILASIIAPPTACLSLHATDATLDTTFPPDVDCATSFPNIARIRHLYVSSVPHCIENDNIAVAGYDSPQHGDRTQLMTLEFDNLEADTMESILPTFEKLPMRLLESVELVGFSHTAFTATKVSHFLAEFATIKSLSLRDEVTSFIVILIVTAESRLCPSLENLQIRSAGVGIETLVELIKSRQTFGCPLAELELQWCKIIDRAGVEELRRLSVTVKWDGEENGDLDSSATNSSSGG